MLEREALWSKPASPSAKRRFRWPLLLPGLTLVAGGCVTPERDYSPHYAVLMPDGGGRRAQALIAPEACMVAGLTPAEAADGMLPAGCANAHNLALMVERKGDLVHGRTLAPGPAAPTARAARQYIDGARPTSRPAAPEASDTASKQP